MTARLVRRVALALIALYAFAQASVALAACGMDRGSMAQAMFMPAGDTCDDCAKPTGDTVGPLCVAHCTADLQAVSMPVDLVVPAAVVVVVMAPGHRFESPPPFVYSSPGAPPRRILLHSFQV